MKDHYTDLNKKINKAFFYIIVCLIILITLFTYLIIINANSRQEIELKKHYPKRDLNTATWSDNYQYKGDCIVCLGSRKLIK